MGQAPAVKLLAQRLPDLIRLFILAQLFVAEAHGEIRVQNRLIKLRGPPPVGKCLVVLLEGTADIPGVDMQQGVLFKKIITHILMKCVFNKTIYLVDI